MKSATNRKAALIGGGGMRTPLLIYGLNESVEKTGVRELHLFDIDSERVGIMAALGKAIVAREGGSLRIVVSPSLEAAVEDADYVINSIRAGGIAARAHDERLAFQNGYPGQETTGPAGFAMALRTIPVVLDHARIIEKHAPDCWYVSFTNPAGLITQAVTLHTSLKVIGICDTPIELFHFIAKALDASAEDVKCEYLGLNHLGWVRRVLLKGQDVTADLLQNDAALRSLYSADLFPPGLIRGLGLIPTEYLFFYYRRDHAYKNQAHANATRGEEIETLNRDMLREVSNCLQAGLPAEAIQAYASYLNQRSGSYMKLEASAGSLFEKVDAYVDPFRASTGYHRMALDVMAALNSDEPHEIVANVRNQSAISDFAPEDVVEVICSFNREGAMPLACGRLPDSVRGLAVAMKAYEYAVIRAAMNPSAANAEECLLIHPSISDWDAARRIVESMRKGDPVTFGAFN